MLDINGIIQIINGVGFPITACIAMGTFIVWDKKTKREDSQQQQAQLQEMFSKVSESINNNTLIITRLVQKLEDGR